MIHIITSLLLYAGIFSFDIIPAFKKKRRKILLFYFPVFVITLLIHFLYGLGFQIPSPADPIKQFVSFVIG